MVEWLTPGGLLGELVCGIEEVELAWFVDTSTWESPLLSKNLLGFWARYQSMYMPGWRKACDREAIWFSFRSTTLPLLPACSVPEKGKFMWLNAIPSGVIVWGAWAWTSHSAPGLTKWVLAHHYPHISVTSLTQIHWMSVLLLSVVEGEQVHVDEWGLLETLARGELLCICAPKSSCQNQNQHGVVWLGIYHDG